MLNVKLHGFFTRFLSIFRGKLIFIVKLTSLVQKINFSPLPLRDELFFL